MRLLLALLAGLALAAPAAAQDRTIYSSLPLSGDSRPQSLDMVEAMRMALEESGRTDVRYVSLDDATERAGAWTPEQVSANARRVAQDDTAVAYLGEFNSGASAISIPILNAAGILQISPSNTYAGLTRGGWYRGEPGMYHPSGKRTFGRIIPADHTQVEALLAYARERGRRRVALVHDGEVYGRGLVRGLRRRAPAYGIRIVGSSRRLGRRNHGAIARAIRSAEADAMIFGGITQTGAVRLWRAVHRLNRRIDLFGPDGVVEPAFSERIGRGPAARTFLTHAALDPAAYPPAGQEFLARFRARRGRDPEPYAIYGYEAMAVALDALARGGNTRAGATPAFFATRDRASVLGTYSIDSNGDTTLTAFGGYRVTRGGALRFDRALVARP